MKRILFTIALYAITCNASEAGWPDSLSHFGIRDIRVVGVPTRNLKGNRPSSRWRRIKYGVRNFQFGKPLSLTPVDPEGEYYLIYQDGHIVNTSSILFELSRYERYFEKTHKLYRQCKGMRAVIITQIATVPVQFLFYPIHLSINTAAFSTTDALKHKQVETWRELIRIYNKHMINDNLKPYNGEELKEMIEYIGY